MLSAAIQPIPDGATAPRNGDGGDDEGTFHFISYSRWMFHNACFNYNYGRVRGVVSQRAERFDKKESWVVQQSSFLVIGYVSLV